MVTIIDIVSGYKRVVSNWLEAADKRYGIR